MFNNCRQYNEEGSMIYEDANKLEEVLVEKVREMGLSSIMTATTASPAVATASLTQSETSSARKTVERRV
jgi:protein polybromo-1